MCFANSTQCFGCRNYLNGPLKEKSSGAIKIEILKDPAKQKSWKGDVEGFELVFDSKKGSHIKDYVHVHLQGQETRGTTSRRTQ